MQPDGSDVAFGRGEGKRVSIQMADSSSCAAAYSDEALPLV